MTAHYQDPALEPQNKPFALLYLVPAGADADIFAWRQLAWDNAQRLLAAPTDKARDRIAREIRRHAKDKAHEILNWYRELATGQGAGASARL